MTERIRSRVVLFALVMGLLAEADSVLAQTSWWTGAGNRTWTDGDATDFNPQYDNGDTAAFGDTGAGTVTNGIGGITPGAVIVNSSGNYTFRGDSIGGTGSLTKDGSGTLYLYTSNSFSGGVFMNGGRIKLDYPESSQYSLGDRTNVLTFTGNSTLYGEGFSPIILGVVKVNAGVSASFQGNDGRVFTFNNALTGSGSVSLGGTGGRVYLHFNSISNTFSGDIWVNGGNDYQILMNSLSDDTPDRYLGMGGSGDSGSFSYGSDAVVPLVLSNHKIRLTGSTGGGYFSNNATNPNCTVTINNDLVNNNQGNKTFGLGGSNTNANTFAGAIGDPPNTATSFQKSGSGKWILTGSNTYSGSTTISSGTLEIGDAGCLGAGGIYRGNIANSSMFRCRSSTNQTWSGVISGSGTLLQGGSGTLTLAGLNSYSGNTTVTNGVLMGVTGGSCSNSSFIVTNALGVTASLGVSITNNTMQWTCNNLTFYTNGVGAQLQFNFDGEPGTNVAPLNILGDLTFNGAPLVVVNGNIKSTDKAYPLLTVGGLRPAVVPAITAPYFTGKLLWGPPPETNTLFLLISGRGTVLVLK